MSMINKVEKQMKAQNEKLSYRLLGRTGVKVSALCLGTMNFGGRTKEKEAFKMMDLALESGINFFDTANVYGHEPTDFPTNAGRSEIIIGNYMHENQNRARIFLASKAFFEMNNELNSSGSARYHLRRECNNSLKRLQTEYIDLYQIHSPSNSIPIEETLWALNMLMDQGKIIYSGSSTFAAWQIVESLWKAKENGLKPFSTEQLAYNLMDRRAERELLPMTQTKGIGVLTWSPLAGGFLTGKYERDVNPDDERYGSFWSKKDRMFDESAFLALDQFKELSESKGVKLDQLAISWLLHQPAVSSIIIGPRTVEQLESNLIALDIEISEDELKKIDGIFTPFETTTPFYGPNARNGFGFIRWGPHKFN